MTGNGVDPRRATAPPGSSERWGGWGAPGTPHDRKRRRPEEGHGSAGGPPGVGGIGGRPEPPMTGNGVDPRRATAPPGVLRALGGLGGARSPPSHMDRLTLDDVRFY